MGLLFGSDEWVEAYANAVNSSAAYEEAAKDWEGSLHTMALLVDGVREVVQVWNENLEAAPGSEEDPRAGYLKGLAQCQERLVILLDLDELAKLDELEEAKSLEGGSYGTL